MGMSGQLILDLSRIGGIRMPPTVTLSKYLDQSENIAFKREWQDD